MRQRKNSTDVRQHDGAMTNPSQLMTSESSHHLWLGTTAVDYLLNQRAARKEKVILGRNCMIWFQHLVDVKQWFFAWPPVLKLLVSAVGLLGGFLCSCLIFMGVLACSGVQIGEREDAGAMTTQGH
ncbi:hypothetical protein Dimus_028348 [Dionaea muscipula]